MNIQNTEFTFIESIKETVRAAQYEALKTVNVQLINLYWELGKAISEKQTEGWGKQSFLILPKNCKQNFHV